MTIWIIGNNLNNSQIQKIIKNKFNFYTTGVSGFVTVEDVVKATMGLMEQRVKNERFILVSENIPFKDFVNYISTKNKNFSLGSKVDFWACFQDQNDF